MDDSQFDELARSLSACSRRSLLATLATSIGAALFAGVGAEDVAAKRKRRQQAKRRHRTSRAGLDAERRKKKKRKKKKPAPPTSPGCTPSCAGKACGAPDGCGESCQTGSCPGAQVCQNGQCVLSCDAGFTLCGSQCVNTQTNASHCGGCNQPCAAQAPESCGASGQCAGGVCQRYGVGTPCGPGTCISGFPTLRDFHICDGGGNCIRQSESCGAYRCRDGTCPGSCTIDDHCMGYAYCQGGSCLPRRTGGETCDRDRQCEWGLCFDGVCCESACVAPPNAQRTCAGGTCVFTCNAGFGNCDGDWSNGCEAHFHTDERHCGGCHQPCVADNATGTCMSGACTYTCLPDYGNCDGTISNGCETDLTQATDHCGACNQACGGACGGAWECINRVCRCI